MVEYETPVTMSDTVRLTLAGDWEDDDQAVIEGPWGGNENPNLLRDLASPVQSISRRGDDVTYLVCNTVNGIDLSTGVVQLLNSDPGRLSVHIEVNGASTFSALLTDSPGKAVNNGSLAFLVKNNRQLDILEFTGPLFAAAEASSTTAGTVSVLAVTRSAKR